MIAHALHPMRGVEKEVRALASIWGFAAVSLVAYALLPRATDLAVATYAIAAIALGAISFGHEHGCGTLGVWLAQPVSRVRLYFTKMGVVAALLFALAVPAAAAIRDNPLPFCLAALCGLFVSPWLTMIVRHTLGGAVLTVVVPALLWVAGDLISIWQFGLVPRDPMAMARFKTGIFTWGTLGWVGVGAALGWRTFSRLEHGGGPGRAFQLFAGRTAGRADAAVRRRVRRCTPVRALIAKELRLQHVTIGAAAIYFLLFLVMYWTGSLSPASGPSVFPAITYVYTAIVPCLAGAVASAEERQLGTLGWQLLQPVAAWKQWLVKVGVVLSVTGMLGLALPLIVMSVAPAIAVFRVTDFEISWVFALALVAVYVSTLNSNALKALVASIPVAILSVFFLFSVIDLVGSGVFRLVRVAFRQMVSGRLISGPQGWILSAIGVEVALLSVAVLALLVRFAYLNHRSLDRDWGTILRQACWMAASVVAVVLVASGSWALFVAQYGG